MMKRKAFRSNRDCSTFGDPSRVDELLRLFDERKRANRLPKRWIHNNFCRYWYFFLGFVAMGSLVKGVGLLICAIGIGIIAGYLYPNTSEELTNAVEEFEGKEKR